MANRGFNGATLTWAGTNTYPVTGLECTINGNKVDISDITKAYMVYTTGLPDIEISADLKGGVTSAMAIGSTGTLTLSFYDSTGISVTTLPATWVITNSKAGGKINQPVDSTVTFCPNT